MNLLKKSKKLNLISACFSKGQAHQGVELGPSAFLNQGLIPQIEGLGFEVKNIELLLNEHLNEEPLHLRCPKSVYKASLDLDECIKSLEKDQFVLTLGGDHSIALGTIHAHHYRNPDFCLFWIDAHADINTTDTTNSGYLHGMMLSFLIKEVREKFPFKTDKYPFLADLNPVLNKENLVYIGLRGIEPEEKKILEALDILYFSMADIDKLGIYKVIELALKKVNPYLKKSIHVSFDIGSLDPSLAPSTGFPVSGGLNLREVFAIGEEIAKTGCLNMLDFVELNPLIGKKKEVERSIKSSIEILLSFLGKER